MEIIARKDIIDVIRCCPENIVVLDDNETLGVSNSLQVSEAECRFVSVQWTS